ARRRGCEGGKRLATLARAFAASTSRSRGGASVTSESSSSRVAWVTCSTARVNACWFALEGRAEPLNFRTNCRADARISSSLAGGWGVLRGFVFLALFFASLLFAAHLAPQ